MRVDFTLPIRPSGDQVKVYNANSRFFVGVIGRQYGKTTLALIRAVRRAIETPGVYYWIEPTITQAKAVFEQRFLPFYHPLLREKNVSDRRGTFLNGSRLFFKGSDAPDSLRGETLNGAVLDECGELHSKVWPEIVRPMLGVNKGWCDFIGTPKGPNWFRDLWLSSVNRPGWTRHHAPSNASPFFPQDEFEEARRTLPDMIFRQEYLAEFVEDDSEVFRGIKECIKGQLEQPINRRRYLIGCDLAKHVDWTVITVWDVQRRHMVAFRRFNQIDWNMQESAIIGMSQQYNNAPIVLDATGVGDPIYDRLSGKGVPVFPVKFTNTIKGNLIRSLQLAIEKRDITFPEIPELISELQMFAVQVGRTGLLSYGAPPGYHDDCVISMALAVSEMAMTSLTAPITSSGRTEMSRFEEV